ncbi:LytR family transcriptional regulator [Clostridia bacterium]|nr:LytR family transcriptional regulator [Clostridia bacterium]
MTRKLTVIILIILSMVACSCYASDDVIPGIFFTIDSSDLNPYPDLPDTWLNILLLGTDDRDADLEDGRSDATIIASLNTITGEIKLASIARDTFVDIPGTYIQDRINTAQRYGGPNLAMKTLNTVFEMNIKKYVRLNMSSLEKIIDILGGVTINLQAGEGGYISTRLSGVRGKTRLSGEEALAYSRIRYLDNDFGRTDRHRTLLIAMYNEVKKNPTPQKMLELTQAILPHVTTNLNLIEILSITTSMMESGLKEIKTLSLPIDGSYKFASDKGRSVLYIEFEPNIKALHKFIYGN